MRSNYNSSLVLSTLIAVLTIYRFVATSIMSDISIHILTKKFQESSLDWALAEDSVEAVLRVATDTSINGELIFPLVNMLIHVA
jgi:hypothetical protein